jgi:hypothetical protein
MKARILPKINRFYGRKDTSAGFKVVPAEISTPLSILLDI